MPAGVRLPANWKPGCKVVDVPNHRFAGLDILCEVGEGALSPGLVEVRRVIPKRNRAKWLSERVNRM